MKKSHPHVFLFFFSSPSQFNVKSMIYCLCVCVSVSFFSLSHYFSGDREREESRRIGTANGCNELYRHTHTYTHIEHREKVKRKKKTDALKKKAVRFVLHRFSLLIFFFFFSFFSLLFLLGDSSSARTNKGLHSNLLLQPQHIFCKIIVVRGDS